MVTVHIADAVKQASSYDDGQVIFDLIAPAIINGDRVEVSFKGIPAVPSAFVNAAFVRLIEVTSFDQVRKNLVITDSTKYINDLIRDRFNFVTSQGPVLNVFAHRPEPVQSGW